MLCFLHNETQLNRLSSFSWTSNTGWELTAYVKPNDFQLCLNYVNLWCHHKVLTFSTHFYSKEKCNKNGNSWRIRATETKMEMLLKMELFASRHCNYATAQKRSFVSWHMNFPATCCLLIYPVTRQLWWIAIHDFLLLSWGIYLVPSPAPSAIISSLQRKD